MRARWIGWAVAALVVSVSAGCGPEKVEEKAKKAAAVVGEEARHLKEAAKTGAAARAAEKVKEKAHAVAEKAETEGVKGVTQEAAKTVATHVKEAARTEKETYKEERAKGESPIEAAGEAYQEVLEKAKKKPAE